MIAALLYAVLPTIRNEISHGDGKNFPFFSKNSHELVKIIYSVMSSRGNIRGGALVDNATL